MDATQLLTIGIVGAALTGIVQFIKQVYGTDGNATKFLTIGLALLFGFIVYSLEGSVYWPSILGILMVSQTVYAFFLR